MKNNKIKIISIVAVIVSMIASFSLGYNIKIKDNYAKNIDNKKETIKITTSKDKYTGKKPKYVFLFIGDGMSYSQLQLANYYLKEMGNNGLDILKLSTNGTMQNPDKTSLIPDSASTATAMATGEKTKSGNINISEDGKEKYETITQKLKKDGYKIGIATTVNINHATPAGFSAHRESRKGYYEIGKEMLNTGFDYFAGGDFKDKKGENGDKKSLEKIAYEKGYTVADSDEEFEKLGNNSKEENSSNDDEKYLVIADDRERTDAMKYSIDKRYEQENGEEKSDSLSDYVKKGIDLLYNEKDKGFFMMVEGGKIDWSCHKNDAASAIYETIDLDNAVDEAIKFYNNHKDETLIIVTGDHETGGLAIGNSNSEYDTNLENLGLQKISCDRFNEEYVSKYKKEKTDFKEVLKDIEYVFGLKKPLVFKEEKAKEDYDDDHKHSDKNSLELTKFEYKRLKNAYELTIKKSSKERTKEESTLYGSHEPITVEAARILAQKSGVGFTSFSHTAAPMAVFAEGVGASEFDGMYDNTELYEKLIDVIY